ncbi:MULTISPECIES: hypothetical protein [unclassified Imperialibacter]|uniref:hypothetical protein n=1 Tax=unclassified Imperialibacter TaxID=2629706 RepID=UPI001259F351|nr:MULTISPECIES: hypothetical protein [unclassified Imperialibacter]CAD5255117.1 conserved hypothetical protein [Imperialibacter sp. 89]CAD5256458.1 conserved hypothetical protein [Imperialibacter sp. 75]VVT20204.1 conserved hypothetical protein [Imperialibacter sp. EC-SDR9]
MNLKYTLHLIASVALLTILSSFASGKWFLFEDKEFGFKIEFPEEPTATPQMIDSEIGQLKMNMVIYDASKKGNDDNLLYMTNVTEYPDSLINSDRTDILDKFFRGAIDGAVNNVKGKLLTEEVKNLADYPGREITVDYGQGMAIIRMRLFLIHNRAYMLQTITETGKSNNESIRRFMDSFQLLK